MGLRNGPPQHGDVGHRTASEAKLCPRFVQGEAPPPSPRGGGRRFLEPAFLPSPPAEGGGAAHAGVAHVIAAWCQRRASACGVRSQAKPRLRRHTVPVVVLVPLAPVCGDGAWMSPLRKGQPGQVRSSAERLCGTASSPAANRSALIVAPPSVLSRIAREGTKPLDPLTEAGPCPGALGGLGAPGAVGACAGPWGTALGSLIMSSRSAPASAAAAADAAAQLVAGSAPATLPQPAGEATGRATVAPATGVPGAAD